MLDIHVPVYIACRLVTLQREKYAGHVIIKIIICPIFIPPRADTFSWWWELCTSMTRRAMLAGVFILLLGPAKPDRLKDSGQTK